MKHYILIFLFFVLFNGYSQDYFGKEWGLRIGFKSNFNLLKYKEMNYQFYKISYLSDDDILVPKFTIGFQKEQKRNNSLIVELSYQDLPQSSIFLNNVEGFGSYVRIFSDTIRTKSQCLQLALVLRKSLEVGIIGKYLELKLANNFVFNKSLQINTITFEHYDSNVKTLELHQKVTSGMVLSPQISFGVGNVFSLTKRLTLDVGLNFGFGFYGRRVDVNSFNNPKKYHKAISSQKLLSNNLLELNCIFTFY